MNPCTGKHDRLIADLRNQLVPLYADLSRLFDLCAAHGIDQDEEVYRTIDSIKNDYNDVELLLRSYQERSP
jgi:hypothetical protein